MKHHSNSDLLKVSDSSEGVMLRQAITMASKRSWRHLTPKTRWTPKARKEFLLQKAEADRNFKNEKIIHFKAL